MVLECPLNECECECCLTLYDDVVIVVVVVVVVIIIYLQTFEETSSQSFASSGALWSDNCAILT